MTISTSIGSGTMIAGYRVEEAEPEHLKHTKVCDAFTIPNAFTPDECERIMDLSKEQSSATMFPCYLKHNSSPVWGGTRYSLVFWPTGPNNGGLV